MTALRDILLWLIATGALPIAHETYLTLADDDIRAVLTPAEYSRFRRWKAGTAKE